MLISFAKLFGLFWAFGKYNLNNNNGLHNPTNTKKFKWGFDTMFMNICLLAGNHNQKKVDLSFACFGYPNAVKFNRLRQLNLLDLKSVYIIKAISIIAPLF